MNLSKSVGPPDPGSPVIRITSSVLLHYHIPLFGQTGSVREA